MKTGSIDFPNNPILAQDLRNCLLLLTQFTQVAWNNASQYEQTLARALTDPLTQLGNRRALEQRLILELARANRFGHPFCLLMVDVDHFKKYNDRMGHLSGDEALRAIAANFRGSLRQIDMVSRYGGEEFCILLSNSGEATGREVGEKLRESVYGLNLEGGCYQPRGHLTISLGLAVCPTHVHRAHPWAPVELIRLADVALYEAKRRGRNRLVSLSELHWEPRRPAAQEPINPKGGSDAYPKRNPDEHPDPGRRLESPRRGPPDLQQERQRICLSHH